MLLGSTVFTWLPEGTCFTLLPEGTGFTLLPEGTGFTLLLGGTGFTLLLGGTGFTLLLGGTGFVSWTCRPHMDFIKMMCSSPKYVLLYPLLTATQCTLCHSLLELVLKINSNYLGRFQPGCIYCKKTIHSHKAIPPCL